VAKQNINIEHSIEKWQQSSSCAILPIFKILAGDLFIIAGIVFKAK